MSENGRRPHEHGPDHRDQGRRHRRRLPRSASRDLHGARDRDRRRRHEPHPRRRGAAAPRRRPRARGRDGLDRRPGARHRSASTRVRPISVPVGAPTLGRLWNVIGEPIDELEPIAGGHRALVDPPRPARVPRPLAEDRDLRDGDQGHRPDRPVREGRQDRPLRRRRRRQDRPHPGADPQRRHAARRRLRVRGRGGADARGERPPARDDGVRRARQGRARLRPDERAAGSAPARGAVRADDGGVLPRRGPGRAPLHRQHLPLRAGGLRGLGAPRPYAERRRLPADARDRDGAAAGADHLDAARAR